NATRLWWAQRGQVARVQPHGGQGMTGGEPPRAVKQADPCSLVVFGASGDLMHRLLVPPLYNLAAGGLLPDAFALIGVGRSEMSDDAFREDLRKSLHQFATRSVEEKIVQRLLGCATYVRGDADEPASYDRLRQALQRIDDARQVAFWSRSGTAITSTMSRSPWRKLWRSVAAVASMTRPARYATWCPT